MRRMPALSVDVLSDDDGAPAAVVPPAPSASLKRKVPPEGLTWSDCRVFVSKAVATNCLCARRKSTGSRNCFRHFRAPDLMDQVIRLRVDLSKLHKQDADEKVAWLSISRLWN